MPHSLCNRTSNCSTSSRSSKRDFISALCLTLSQVTLFLPTPLVARNRPFAAHLELWHDPSHTRLDETPLLLLPDELLDVAANLDSLAGNGRPYDSEPLPTRGNADFVADLTFWLHHFCRPGHRKGIHQGAGEGAAASSFLQQEASLGQEVLSWDLGWLLMRQSVLWGLPALTTLLIDSLMALPKVGDHHSLFWLLCSLIIIACVLPALTPCCWTVSVF